MITLPYANRTGWVTRSGYLLAWRMKGLRRNAMGKCKRNVLFRGGGAVHQREVAIKRTRAGKVAWEGERGMRSPGLLFV